MRKITFSREDIKKGYFVNLLDIKESTFERLEIVTFNFKDGKPGALIWQGKRSKPNKYVKFVSNESRNEYIDNYKANEKSIMDKKRTVAEIRKNAKHPYKVGDILTGSWGYDQTNVDAFQVTELKGKSVVLERIGVRSVEGSDGFMSDQVMPIKNDFIIEGHRTSKVKKLPQTNDGKSWHVRLNYCCYLTLWDGLAMYRSWYG